MDGDIASILPVMLFFNAFYAATLSVVIILIVKFIHGIVLGIVKSENKVKGMRKRYILAIFVLSLIIISIPSTKKIFHDRKKADQLVAYCDEYKQKYGQYPENMQDMVPEFFDKNQLAEFRSPKDRGSHSIRYNGMNGHPHIFYMTGVPFFYNDYNFEKMKWIHRGI